MTNSPTWVGMLLEVLESPPPDELLLTVRVVLDERADGWPALLASFFPFPFRNCGCPALAFFARAGTMLPIP